MTNPLALRAIDIGSPPDHSSARQVACRRDDIGAPLMQRDSLRRFLVATLLTGGLACASGGVSTEGTGGSSGVAGSKGSGGTTASGGAPATGGSVGSGGIVGSGGSVSSGGAPVIS